VAQIEGKKANQEPAASLAKIEDNKETEKLKSRVRKR